MICRRCFILGFCLALAGCHNVLVQYSSPMVASGGAQFVHGQPFTITGSGFGSTIPQFVFAGGTQGDIEQTSIGSTPSFGNNTSHTSGGNAGTFNWTRFLGGAPSADVVVLTDATRGKSVGFSDPNSGGGSEVGQEVNFFQNVPFSGKFMAWHYARHMVTNLGGVGPQVKFLRLQGGTSNISDTAHNMVYTYQQVNGGNMVICNSAGGPGNDTWYSSGYNASLPSVDGTWKSVQIKGIAPSGVGNLDGQIYYRAHTPGSTFPAYINPAAAGTGDLLQSQVGGYPDSSNKWDALTYQNWCGNGYANMTFALDDHFIQQGSFAHVELWDTNNPATATYREMQEPTAWSDTSITIRCNKGGFPLSSGYVVVLSDSLSDVVLASTPVTVSAGAG